MKFYEKLSDASSSASSSAHTSPQGSRSMSPKVGDEGRKDGGGFQLRKERGTVGKLGLRTRLETTC